MVLACCCSTWRIGCIYLVGSTMYLRFALQEEPFFSPKALMASTIITVYLGWAAFTVGLFAFVAFLAGAGGCCVGHGCVNTVDVKEVKIDEVCRKSSRLDHSCERKSSVGVNTADFRELLLTPGTSEDNSCLFRNYDQQLWTNLSFKPKLMRHFTNSFL